MARTVVAIAIFVSECLNRRPRLWLCDGPAPAGIDYLAALGDAHDAGLKEQVSYRSLIDGGRP